MPLVKPIRLWTSQQEFFSAGPTPTLYFAGVGTGKSFVLVLKMLALLDQYPGSRGVICRQRFQQLKKTTSATLFKLLNKDHIARRNDNEGTLTLTNGSQLLLMHLEGVDTLSNLKSLELNFAAIDQAEDISVEAWDTLYERLGRWSGATMRGGWPKDWPYKNRMGENVPPRYFFANCYSPGWDHFLTARFYEHGTERAKYRERGYQVVIGSTDENLALTDEYIADRMSQGEEYVRRFVKAQDWGAREGRIFNLSDLSILEPTAELISKIKRTMRLHRVLDHGEFAPTACLWYATDHRGNVFFYREYHQADKLVSEHREAIYQMSAEDGDGTVPPHYYSQYADPAIFAKNRGRTTTSKPTYSVADEYMDVKLAPRRTMIAWRPAVNDEESTLNKVKEYLRVDPHHIHPITGKRGAPHAYFLKRTDGYPFGCHETLVDIRNARRKEMGTAPDGTKMYHEERDDKVRDHCLDTVRYALVMRPGLGAAPPGPPDDPGTIRLNDYFKLQEEEAVLKRAADGAAWRGRKIGY